MTNKKRKEQKNFRIDASVVSKFAEICARKKIAQNEEVENLMRQYIVRDGEAFTDEVYAPWLANQVEAGMDRQVTRMAKMLYQTQVNTDAALLAQAQFYKDLIDHLELAFKNYFIPQLFNPNAESLAEKYTIEEDGEETLKRVRTRALKIPGIRRKELNKLKKDIRMLFDNALGEGRTPDEIEEYNNKLDDLLKKI